MTACSVADCGSKSLAACRKGHRYPDDLKLTPTGGKRCPECERENNRKRRARAIISKGRSQ